MNCRKCKRETPTDALFCPYCGVSLEPKKNTHKTRTRPNGAGTAYKRGKTYTACIVIGWKIKDDHAVPIYKTKGGFQRKKDALDYCSELRKTPKQKVVMTVKQIYDAWLPSHEIKVGKSTMDCYRAAWKYFAPLYDVPFEDIDLDDLQECVNDCPRGKRTKENMKALAGLLMKYAIPRHQTDLNYAEYIHTGNDKKGTHPAFTPEQVELIRQQIGKTPYADYVYALIYTGFRPTELFYLPKHAYENGILYGGIKTEAGKDRAVPVSPRIAEIIGRKMESDSEWLFPREDGSQMSVNYFRDYCFYPVLAAAGIQEIPTEDKPAYYVPYSCRHTFANMLKDVQGSDKDKAGLIGHTDYKTTKKHYQSVELDNLKAIIQQL